MKKELEKINRSDWRKKTLHHISPTGTVEKYLNCPLQFWFDKISGLKKEEKKSYFVFGTAVHSANEEALRMKKDGVSLSKNSDCIVDTFTSYMYKESKGLKPRDWGRESFTQHMAKGKKMVDLAIKRYEEMPIKPIDIEKDFTYKWDDTLLLNCKIDLICEFTKPYKMLDGTKIKAGDIVIIDHKTASRKYNSSAIGVSNQLTFYSYVFRNTYFTNENYVAFQAFMKYKYPEIQDYVGKRTEKDMIILHETIDGIIENIENGVFYPTFKADVCAYRCDYKDICKNYCCKEDRMKREDEFAKTQGYSLEV
jgi:hypothetical protein